MKADTFDELLRCRLSPFFILFFAILLPSCAQAQPSHHVCFQQQCYEVEVVDTDETRRRGLQFRESMPPDHGMLFVFPQEDIYPFWMKDTLIPLDMIWLDPSQWIVHIEENVPPCRQDPCVSYTPSANAGYVLELNAGQVAQLGLQIGDRLDFRLDKYLTP